MMSRSLPLATGGIIPPMPTPLTPDGAIDVGALGRLADHLVSGGVDGAFIAGTSGMGPLLTERQYGRLAESALTSFDGRLPVLAGVIETSTARALERIRLLESLGYRQFVLTSTFYLPPANAEQLLSHFGICAEATDMQMVVYDIPVCTGVSIAVETIAEMARRGWTRMVKDSSGDAEHFAELCRVGNEQGLAILQGLLPDMAGLIKMGAAGCVPVTANVRPDLFAAAWGAAQQGDAATTAALQAKIDGMWHTLVAPGDFLSGSLYVLARAGLLQEVLPDPLRPAEAGRRAAIDAAFDAAGGFTID